MVRITPLVAVVLLLVTAGCAQGVQRLTCSHDRGGAVEGQVVETAPANATVTDSAQLPDDARFVREALNEAAESDNKRGSAHLTAVELCHVEASLADLPRHEGDRFGYYVRHDGTLVRVTLEYET
jgi:hypothetical protein